uniref:Succinate dehydrogenase subunit 4 n=1 Tax=Osmundea sinicola TaxID=290685 RepID=A0A7L4WP62_9FLOR|nr:succinate dehydrogenase subunit 4 [Osmundea sinicola]QFR99786.1 succinate dehydrogenase subunit 4 [Osmundea sinicola]
MFTWVTKNFYINFLLVSLFLDIEFSVITFNFFFLHIFYGFTSIVKDYIHMEELKIFLNFMIRFLLLNIIIILIEFFF